MQRAGTRCESRPSREKSRRQVVKYKMMNTLKIRFPTLHFKWLFLLSMLVSTSACSEKMVPAGVVGYNHTKDRPIQFFSVNGASGPNVNPENGGGKESCCVSVPAHWRPGLKATIEWEYDTEQNDPNPPPPRQKAVVDIPEYKVVGNFQVHFYPNHKVKVVVSMCSIEHPFYPMSLQDKLPWAPDGSKQEAIDAAKRGGGTIDC